MKGTNAAAAFEEASVIHPPNKSHNYRIASIPADGIGPEVVSAAIEVVEKLAKTLNTFTIEFTHIPWGTAYYKKTGAYVDENVLDVLRSYDAALFGSVGAPGWYSASRSPRFRHVKLIVKCRCSRSHFPLGSPARYSRTSSALCQCSPCSHFPWHSVSSPHCRRQRH